MPRLPRCSDDTCRLFRTTRVVKRLPRWTASRVAASRRVQGDERRAPPAIRVRSRRCSPPPGGRAKERAHLRARSPLGREGSRPAPESLRAGLRGARGGGFGSGLRRRALTRPLRRRRRPLAPGRILRRVPEGRGGEGLGRCGSGPGRGDLHGSGRAPSPVSYPNGLQCTRVAAHTVVGSAAWHRRLPQRTGISPRFEEPIGPEPGRVPNRPEGPSGILDLLEQADGPSDVAVHGPRVTAVSVRTRCGVTWAIWPQEGQRHLRRGIGVVGPTRARSAQQHTSSLHADGPTWVRSLTWVRPFVSDAVLLESVP
jgi:hypothetical protein